MSEAYAGKCILCEKARVALSVVINVGFEQEHPKTGREGICMRCEADRALGAAVRARSGRTFFLSSYEGEAGLGPFWAADHHPGDTPEEALRAAGLMK